MRWLRSGAVGWRQAAVAAAAIVVVLAGCGGSQQSSAAPGPAFPSTPAGVQAQWLFQAIGTWPIPDAALRAHFAAAYLAKNPPAAFNTLLAEFKRLSLVSVTSTRPDSEAFVMSVRGAQRFRVDLTLDAHGLIGTLTTQELPPTASPASAPRAGARVGSPAGHVRGGRGHDLRHLHPSRQRGRGHGPGCAADRGPGGVDRPQRQRPGGYGPPGHAGGGGQLAVRRRGGQPPL